VRWRRLVLETLKTLQYNEDNISTTYAKSNYTKSDDKSVQLSKLRKESDSTSQEDRADSVDPIKRHATINNKILKGCTALE